MFSWLDLVLAEGRCTYGIEGLLAQLDGEGLHDGLNALENTGLETSGVEETLKPLGNGININIILK